MRRRIIDLNQPATVFIKLIGFFGIMAPGALYGAAWLAGDGSVPGALLWRAIPLSVTIGAVLLVVLVVLVVVEQAQDHLFDAQYRRQRSRKVPLGDGYYECQYCGNRQVRADDQACSVCGEQLESRE